MLVVVKGYKIYYQRMETLWILGSILVGRPFGISTTIRSVDSKERHSSFESSVLLCFGISVLADASVVIQGETNLPTVHSIFFWYKSVGKTCAEYIGNPKSLRFCRVPQDRTGKRVENQRRPADFTILPFGFGAEPRKKTRSHNQNQERNSV